MDDNKKNILKNQYEGSKALNYDSIRKVSDRHIAEISIIKDYIMQIKPKYILDCPCGTMRWIDIYASSGASVFGFDISKDMIEQARMKVTENKLENKIFFLQGDIFNNNFVFPEVNFDMGLCVRFLNWIPMKIVFNVLTLLNKYSKSYLLIGCTVIPSNSSLLNRIKAKYYIFIDNINRIKKKSAIRYVHNEKKFEIFLKTLDWTMVEKKITMNKQYTVNYLYLFKKYNRF
ncbi:MAG: class I SAM-dependent methyltransferase [Spirochaetaceae bacterium]|nr:class I SAM-dependent methyltransferase [Spirochaetaceae bacterium]